MRVRLTTSVVGILGRGLLLLLIGAGIALWADHNGYIDLPAVTSGATSTQAPAPPQVGSGPPTAAAAPVAPAPVKATTPAKPPPPGSIDFLGIIIPPPGSNDPH